MVNFYGVCRGQRAATVGLFAQCAHFASRLLCTVFFLCALPALALAQSGEDIRVEVVVADQGQKQRNSAYWLSLDSILRRNMPALALDAEQRAKVLREASRYVQSFRYRRFEAADSARLATRVVRDGSAADSVIVVTFPADLENILRQQTTSEVAVEMTELPEPAPDILALVAVDQETTQFLIGGNRGKKFQSRMTQLGSTNSLAFQFPILDRGDKELITAADVLFNQTDKLDGIASKYQTDRRLSAALFRLSEEVWQTEWRYVVDGQIVQVLNLTTRTLDEALVTVVSELGDGGGGYRADSYLGQSGSFQRDGVALRVENVNSVTAYQTVLAALKNIEPTLVTETLESGAIVFRAPQATLSSLQQAVARMPELSLLSSAVVANADMVARFVGR